ncbi:MAG TPA: glutathione S-transferase family protein [Caulobacteraceae bacterium]|nr:glutathione S-transferase family protein [Caulobacteraceae bacterium]
MPEGADFILHHYDASPFSEKARLMFGIKGLSWRSVIQPNIMPKPDLTPLTGGYRRAPVMQIGADVFCDTQVILLEIERREPRRVATSALGWAVNLWADRVFFGVTVPVIFGEIGEQVPQAFIKDREKLSGRPFDIAAMKAAAAPMRGQWRSMAGWIDGSLWDAPFLAGERPGIVDIAAYMNVWFLAGVLPKVADELLTNFAKVAAWRERMAQIGHGTRTEMTAAEALEIAAGAEPDGDMRHDRADPLGLEPGAPVQVSADDYGRDPISGTLVAANSQRVVIERRDERLGRLHVHFPRAGYVVAPGPRTP